MNKEYDVIVVGSGPGGATVARELSQKGKKVLILEWGSNAPVDGSFSQFAMNAGIPGKSVLFSNRKFLAMFRGICTGGSSIFYCGTAFDPPYEMLTAYGIDIENEVAALKEEIPVAPLPDDLVGPAAGRMMDSALDLGYEWKKLNKFIYPEKCRLGCAKCSYGCPYDAKWTARNFIEEAVDNGAKLIPHARVSRVLVENGRAVGVEYRRHLTSHRLYADTTVVAAGGIGSPVILRHSGIEDAGHDFFFDPLITVFGNLPGLHSTGEPQMAAGIHMKDEGFVMTDLSFSAPLIAVQSLVKMKAHRAFSKPGMLMLMVKIKDELGGRITESGGIRKSLSDADKAKLKQGYKRAREVLENAGARDVYAGGVVAAHPGGTVKIGELLDSDLKTQIDHLYVCDCSVIPEAWGLPPTLTLLGLGKRLAGHLLNL